MRSKLVSIYAGVLTAFISASASAEIGHELLSGDILFACKPMKPVIRKEFMVIEDGSSVSQGKVSANTYQLMVFENFESTSDGTSVKIFEAHSKRDKADSSFLDIYYQYDKANKSGEVLRVNTSNLKQSELVIQQGTKNAGGSTQVIPMYCTLSKISIHTTKKRRS